MDESNDPSSNPLTAALDSAPVKNLLGPLTKNIGDTLGYVGDIVRFYSFENLGKIFTKWAASRPENKPIEAEEFKRILPLLPLAAHVSDDEMQERWANLLQAASTGTRGYLPSFGTTLSQLTPEEAKFIEKIETAGREAVPGISNVPMTVFNYEQLRNLFDSDLLNTYFYHWVPLSEQTEEQKSVADKVRQADLVLEDLERLKIIAAEIEAKGESRPQVVRYGSQQFKIEAHKTELQVTYYLTQYGKNFLGCVRLP